MRKIAILIISILMLFGSLSACNKEDKDPEQTSVTTSGTTITTATQPGTTTNIPPKDDMFSLLLNTVYVKSEKGPDTNNSGAQYAIDIAHPHARIIGHDYTIYLYFKDEYYELLEFEAPVSEYGNAFMSDANGDGSAEVFIYDFAGDRSAILVYDDENDAFLMYITKGLLYFNDFETSGSYLFYSYQNRQYPYELWLYKFVDGKPVVLDVAKFTGSEYAHMAEGRYIFAGSKQHISLYTIINNEMIEYDGTLYIRSRLIFPDAQSKLITADDLRLISRFQIDHSMDQILSMHGFVFDDEYLNYYYDIFPWYIADQSFTADMLSDIEKKNIEFLMEHLRMLDSNMDAYESMSANVDLNMDNDLEMISLEITSNDFILKINDRYVEGTGDNLINKLFITDIDKSDGYLEIGVAQAGPSDDYETYFYRYDGVEIISMGMIEGPIYDMSIPGDGSVLSYKRGSVMQTWFYPYRYGINGHTFIGIDEEEYIMNTFVLLREDLDVYKKPGDTEALFVIRAGEPALIVSSNDKDHCKILSLDGQEGFFYVSRFNLINDTGIDSGSYFHGMNFAD